MTGMLAMACGDVARYARCHASVWGLNRPPGTTYFQASGLSVAANFNEAAREFLKDPEHDWLFLLNDDHDYPPDTLSRLLQRMYAEDLDVVTGLYLSRKLPFYPLLYGTVDEAGFVGRRLLAPGDKGLIPIVACGDGCLLIRRRVLEALTDPWWQLGYLDAEQCNHDLAFCRRVREAGFQIWADLDVPVAHLTPVGVLPRRTEDGQWFVDVCPPKSAERITFPMASSVDDEVPV